MYGNAPNRADSGGRELTTEQQKLLRQELTDVAARTRKLLPTEFVVGSEISQGVDGPRATVAVQPPIGAMVSADYTPEGKIDIDDAQREDLAVGLAASAALQVKEAIGGDVPQTAK
jgi:hypothetical protein